jgi:hypothetical protein
MTEADWLTCTNPIVMLEFLRGKASDRKLRLFAVACCRRIWPLLTDERSRKAVEVAEHYADGLAHEEELEEARWRAGRAYDAISRGGTGDTKAAATAANAAHADSTRTYSGLHGASKQEHADLLREIVNPFYRGTFDRAIVEANGGKVRVLATAIRNQKRFNDLPILADLLAASGCRDQAVLDHFRRPGEHLPGCWALDVVLGEPPPQPVVTEAEWLAGTNAKRMLNHVLAKGSDRKLRLFACAAIRDVLQELPEDSRQAVLVAERFADGVATKQELKKAGRLAQNVAEGRSDPALGEPT